MTALTTHHPDAMAAGASPGYVAGFSGLLRKELTEWRRARRTRVVLLVSTAFMALSALNSWLQAHFVPADGSEGIVDPITDPFAILASGVAGQIFAVAAIFAVMGLLVVERENGTLAWTASKPVSRSGIWLSKALTSVGVLWVVAGLLPLAVSVGIVVAVYGGLAVEPVVIMGVGTGLSIALFVAVSLAASTVVTSQAAVAAIAIGVMFLPQLLGILVPPQFLPTSILEWTILVAAGEPASLVTPIAWLAAVTVLVLFSLRRMEAMEL